MNQRQPLMKNDRLRRALEEHRRALSQAVLDRMYENPFWMERFGERGRRFADEDSDHHVRYLDQALAADDPAIFEKYARWLRAVLVSRGMCSEHLAENFRLLGQEIARRGLADAAAGAVILEAGTRALIYVDGDAGRLEGHRAAFVDVVEQAAAPGEMREDDRRYLVSYLIDATATGDRAFFDQFARRFHSRVTAALLESAAPYLRT